MLSGGCVDETTAKKGETVLKAWRLLAGVFETLKEVAKLCWRSSRRALRPSKL
jgi:hypothetical protein